MQFQEFLDSLPILGVFATYSTLAAVSFELCFRFGRWIQNRTIDEQEAPTGVLVGSLLGLMAFLLAITTGMATDRFDTRRGLVLTESNSIGTTYLRAGYLPESASRDSRALLREYVSLRIAPKDLADIRDAQVRAAQVLDDLWAIAEDLARATPESHVLALYIDSLNETIDLQQTRLISGLYARVPETVLFLLFLGSALTLGMVGYDAGLHRKRNPITAAAMVVVVGAVIMLVVDLDRPRDGFLKVSQQPLIDLQRQIGSPPG